MKALLTVLLLLIAAPAVAMEKGDRGITGVICSGPKIVESITELAKTSEYEAGRLQAAATRIGICTSGDFPITLVEKFGELVDIRGDAVELWRATIRVKSGDLEVYTFVLAIPRTSI